ncbi:MAG: hypothetical protein C4589_12305 [Peptococcaceae bacterium]|nr:MAG: hypothetical protein C4589_12305 [Peptococcaceae bacterium]
MKDKRRSSIISACLFIFFAWSIISPAEGSTVQKPACNCYCLYPASSAKSFRQAAAARRYGEEGYHVPENTAVIIDMDRLTLTLFADNKYLRRYPVAMGKYETPTPVGNWKIVSREISPHEVLGTRWMGLNIPYGRYGIHGTNQPGSIGTFASHGCIRMHNAHVEEIFSLVSEGTPVTIIGSPFGAPGTPPYTLGYGDSGPPVLEMQKALRRLGFYKGFPDGFWGKGTEEAVRKFRAAHGLKGENVIDEAVYRLLGY